MKSAKMAALSIIGAFIAAGCLGITPRIESDNSIAVLEKVEIGGEKQWLLIRGQDRDNPILLFLHGGPGSPEMNLNHRYGAELERDFVLAHWEQRGSGKSLHLSTRAGDMHVERFVKDCHEVTDYLLDRFGRDKLFLAGHSWGSLLGVLVVAERPERYRAYVGLGQVADIGRNEEISYRFVMEEAERRGNGKALRELSGLEPPLYGGIGGLMTQRKWLRKFGGFMYGEDGYGDLPAAALMAPEYTAADHLKYVGGAYFSALNMWDEIAGYNLIEQVPRLDVPVYFFVGRHDYNTPFELAVEYFEALDAPRGKKLVWFEQSAHSPNLEEPEKFARMMRDVVLAENAAQP